VGSARGHRRLGIDAAAIVAWVGQHASEMTPIVAAYTLATVQTGPPSSRSCFGCPRRDRIVAWIPDLLSLEQAQSEASLPRVRDVIYGRVVTSSSSGSSRERSASACSGSSGFHPPRCGDNQHVDHFLRPRLAGGSVGLPTRDVSLGARRATGVWSPRGIVLGPVLCDRCGDPDVLSDETAPSTGGGNNHSVDARA